MGYRGGKNLLDRMAFITDGKQSLTDGINRQFCAELYETGLQAPGPASDNPADGQGVGNQAPDPGGDDQVPDPGGDDQAPDPGEDDQVPDPGSEAVRIPSATSGRMPILT